MAEIIIARETGIPMPTLPPDERIGEEPKPEREVYKMSYDELLRYYRQRQNKKPEDYVAPAHLSKFRVGGRLIDYDVHTAICGNEEALAALPKQDDKIITNPSPAIASDAPFRLGRYENRRGVGHSSVVLFHENCENGHYFWDKAEEVNGKAVPKFDMAEDPFCCGVIDGYHVIGFVKITRLEDSDKLTWKTVFYRYKNSIAELVNDDGNLIEPFAEGPEGMKDIRLCQLPDGRIAVFTRPQGEISPGHDKPKVTKGGLGKIAFATIEPTKSDNTGMKADLLGKLAEAIREARIIEELFVDDVEWGGVNQVFALEDGNIGVLGHIAKKEKVPIIAQDESGNPVATEKIIKHYAAIAFVYNPDNNDVLELQMIATGNDFLKTPAKEVDDADLDDVIFSAALERIGGNRAFLHVGLRDRMVGSKEIPDPFEGYERRRRQASATKALQGESELEN